MIPASRFCPVCRRPRSAHDNHLFCEVPPPSLSSEYEAARVSDPERAAWDVFDDGGLERPGEDEL